MYAAKLMFYCTRSWSLVSISKHVQDKYFDYNYEYDRTCTIASIISLHQLDLIKMDIFLFFFYTFLEHYFVLLRP